MDGCDKNQKYTLMNSLGFEKEPRKTRVVVAMSGGVDSSVVAAKLKNEGYNVIGITLQLYDHGKALEKKGACCAGLDINDARRTAQSLELPHYVLNYESQFKEKVIDDFADSYLAGYTPVPCIRCNERIKFSDLLKTAKSFDADCLATGHYVRQTFGRFGAELHRARDEKKDQSYFLFATTREQLKYLRFPLGNMQSKDETRSLANKFGLKVASKPDSQDICFVPNGSYSEVIKKLRPEANKPGEIVNCDGDVIGRHAGVVNFTIGQRRGLGIGGGQPLYVIRIEPETHKVVVGPRDALMKRNIKINKVNWLGERKFTDRKADGWDIEVKIRSTRPPVSARVFPSSETQANIVLSCNEQGVAPGQACVFYQPDSSRVLGGGWITN